MKIKNKTKYNIRPIDMFITSLLVFTTACFVYSFFYLLIDVFRCIAIDFWDKELILTGDHRPYFNVFFAGIGILLGQALGLQYLMSRITISTFQKVRIINDGWFSIWVSLFVIMQCVALLLHYDNIFSVDSFTDFFPWLTILAFGLLVMLFAISWNGLRRYIIGVQFYKFMIGLFVFLGVSVGIGQIEVLNQDVLEHNILKNNVVYKYQLDYPESNYTKKIKRRSLVVDFSIVKHPDSKSLEVFYESIYIPLDKLSETLDDIENGFRTEDLHWVTLGLRIDKNIPLKELLPVFEIFYLNGFERMAIYVDENSYDDVFTYKLDPDIFYDYLKEESRELGTQKNRPGRKRVAFVKGYFKTDGGIDIYCYPNRILVEGQPFTVNTFLNVFKRKSYNNHALKLHSLFIDIDVTFGEYIHAKSMIYKAYEQLRNDFALQQYNTPFRSLSGEQSKEVRKEYPLNIKEFGLHNLDSLRMDAFFKENRFNSRYNCIPD